MNFKTNGNAVAASHLIVIVDDNAKHAETLIRCVRELGHTARYCYGGEALFKPGVPAADLYVINWRLPMMQGADVMRRLRESKLVKAPIIFSTARCEDDELAHVLERGADDFLVEPLNPAEVKARITNVLRRHYATEDITPNLELPPYSIDFRNRAIRLHGKLVALQSLEFELAALFFRNLNEALPRQIIAREIWNGRPLENSRTIDTHVSRIRKKLQIGPQHGLQLDPVYGVGYWLLSAPEEFVAPPPPVRPRWEDTFADMHRMAETQGD